MARQKQEVLFKRVDGHNCGLDVHKKEIMTTVGGIGLDSEIRTFQSTTRSLKELKDYLTCFSFICHNIRKNHKMPL
jgi:hypothetical protein